MNAQAMMQFMGAANSFKQAHPKFAAFISDMVKRGFCEGDIIEITVTKNGESGITSNMRVTQADLELFESLKNLKQ